MYGCYCIRDMQHVIRVIDGDRGEIDEVKFGLYEMNSMNVLLI